MFLHFTIHLVLKKFRKRVPHFDHVNRLSHRDKLYYTSYYQGLIHAVYGTVHATYGFLYADGQQGTTWFHCYFYKLHMFDIQKYLSMISVGYVIQDFIFCIWTTDKFDGLTVQLYVHHLIILFGNGIAVWIGGFVGSLSQITFIVELPNILVNFYFILGHHKLEGSLLYTLNGVLMAILYFIFRPCFYYYMICM